MIILVAAVSCGAAAWLRIALGPFGATIPWIGLAWTLLFARHSRRATFAAIAIVVGVVDGLVAPAAWTVWPAAYLVAGTLAFATRRVLPVRQFLGELVLGTLAAVLVRVMALPFPPAGLPGGRESLGAEAASFVLTGVVTAILVAIARRWTLLRMRLTSVT